MFKWIKNLIPTVSCATCDFCSDDRLQGPRGGLEYYCSCPKTQDTKYSYVENRVITISYPCKFENAKGHCRHSKQKGG